VIALFDIPEAVLIWKTKKRDFVILLVSFVATLVLGVETGILASVGFNAIIFLLSMDFMKVEDLSQGSRSRYGAVDDPDRQVEEALSGLSHAGIVVIRPADSLCFANVEHFTEQADKLLSKTVPVINNTDAIDSSQAYLLGPNPKPAAARNDSGVPQLCLVVDMSRVNTIDSTAILELSDYVKRLQSSQRFVAFAAMQTHIEERLAKSGQIKKIGIDHFSDSVNEAIALCKSMLNSEVAY